MYHADANLTFSNSTAGGSGANGENASYDSNEGAAWVGGNGHGGGGSGPARACQHSGFDWDDEW